jgi:hypothetical protein
MEPTVSPLAAAWQNLAEAAILWAKLVEHLLVLALDAPVQPLQRAVLADEPFLSIPL